MATTTTTTAAVAAAAALDKAMSTLPTPLHSHSVLDCELETRHDMPSRRFWKLGRLGVSFAISPTMSITRT